MRLSKIPVPVVLIVGVVVVLAIVNRPGAPVTPGPQAPRTPAPSVPSVGGEATPGTAAPGFDQRRDWALDILQARSLWAITEGAGVTVAVVDTGVDTTQPDLAGAVQASAGQGSAPADQSSDSHGTAIAGLIAGRGSVTNPGQHVIGLAPKAQLIDIRVASQPDAVTAADIAGGIYQAALSGARVINVSLGVPHDDGNVIRQAVAYARGHGRLVVASAGVGSAPQYPAASPGVLAVGAISQAGVPLTPLSDYPHRAVYAPGADLYSTAEMSPAGGGHDGYVSRLSGSGYAAAYVSAAAALILSAYPGLTAGDVATDLVQLASPGAGATGFGLIDPLKVLSTLAAQAQPPVTVAPNPAGTTPTEVRSTAPASGLASTPPPAPGSSLRRVDLVIGATIVLLLVLVLLWLLIGGGPGPPDDRRVEYTASTWEAW